MGVEGRSPLAKGPPRLEHAYLTQQELDRINQIIADYHDVLMDTTARAWDRLEIKGVATAVMVAGMPTPYVMDLRKFAHDVRKWYTFYKGS